ncbi:hypothetical protein [Spiroplasma endosymbiont of Labia minor]|uniref:hypothetical protein n=1 Tax=Spiroplasma endosymbiont of Labia minor TaxID=3066305 RepID=UPI0030D0AE5B
MFKMFLLLTSISNIGASSLAVISTTQSLYNEITAIEQSIKDNSWFLREEDIYLYQNKEYRNKNEILEDVIKENPLEEISTSSNPNKIMLDVNSGKLDLSQVYSTKKDDYVKVYQNTYGNVLLPSCSEVNFIDGCIQSDESARERALDSYVSLGNIRIKYSYDNSNWRDSTEEAMTAYKNAKYSEDIQSSLFYNFKGLKYNAFNQNDLQKMKSIMTPGIYYDPIDSNAGDELSKPFIEKRDNFGKTIVNKINTEINSTLTDKNENLYE